MVMNYLRLSNPFTTSQQLLHKSLSFQKYSDFINVEDITLTGILHTAIIIKINERYLLCINHFIFIWY